MVVGTDTVGLDVPRLQRLCSRLSIYRSQRHDFGVNPQTLEVPLPFAPTGQGTPAGLSDVEHAAGRQVPHRVNVVRSGCERAIAMDLGRAEHHLPTQRASPTVRRQQRKRPPDGDIHPRRRTNHRARNVANRHPCGSRSGHQNYYDPPLAA